MAAVRILPGVQVGLEGPLGRLLERIQIFEPQEQSYSEIELYISIWCRKLSTLARNTQLSPFQ